MYRLIFYFLNLKLNTEKFAHVPVPRVQDIVLNFIIKKVCMAGIYYNIHLKNMCPVLRTAHEYYNV